LSTDVALEVRLAHRVHAGLSLLVSFRLGHECGVLFGPSGAGKTTVLRLIAGLTKPELGHVRLDGEVVFDTLSRVNRPLRLRRIGMIFQDDLLFPHLSVAANIRFGLRGRPQAEISARLAEVAALCGIESLLARRPESLSGGERQRVGLARALAPRPRLLLCDEPISALDLATRDALIERLRAIQRAERIPVLYVTHSPAEAIALGTRLFLLETGKLVEEGPPLEVLAGPRAGRITRLEGLRNIFPARVEGNSDSGDTIVRLVDGPLVIVPAMSVAPGAALAIEVRGDDVLLARGALPGVSARNTIVGVVDRVHVHGAEAEVVVRTGGISWIVSVVASAVASMELAQGAEIYLLIKARSIRIINSERSE
jgi:molybdate transport system ATP-binding protein